MRLSDRVGRSESADGTNDEPAMPPASAPAAASPAVPRANDPLAEIKERAQHSLFQVLGPSLKGMAPSDRAAQRKIDELLEDILVEDEVLLTPAERRDVAAAVADNLLGLGPIQKLVDDPTVSEIMVNAPNAVFVERFGQIEETDVAFYSAAHLRSVIERIVDNVGRRIDESTPMVDARLADGSRVNAVLPPLTIDSPTLTIRKFPDSVLDADRMLANNTLSVEAGDFLRGCVGGRCNVLVSGGTGTGKTTMLNVLSSFISPGDRVITIEDTAELQLQQRHVVRMESRPVNAEGRGEVAIRDLVRNALRMRPDRLVIGECRGPEAMDMLQAMNTGHDGSLSTLHANSTRDALSRLETMVLMAGIDLPHRAIREQITSAVDLIVHLTRLADGSRRVTEITELAGMEGDVIQLTPIYEFDWAAGRGVTGEFLGSLKPTGLRPGFTERLLDLGIEFHPDTFADPDLDPDIP